MYKIGDTVWYFETGHNGEKSSAEVIGTIEHFGETIYVLANPVPGIGEFVYYARPEYALASAKDAPLNLWSSYAK